MRKAWLVLPFLLIPAMVAAGGASRRSPSPASSAAGPDVFLGYSYTRAGEASLHGWQLSGSYPLKGALRLVADLNGHYGSFAQADLGQLSFLAGARRLWTKGPFLPFAEVLLGGVRTKTSVVLPNGTLSDSDTDWGGALGGGVEYHLASRWAARAQLDLLLLRAEGSWESDPRLSIGVVYRLGR